MVVVRRSGRCTGQKSPNENGPLRHKLMTGRIKKARFPFNTLNYSGLRGTISIADAVFFPPLSLTPPAPFPRSDRRRRTALPRGYSQIDTFTG